MTATLTGDAAREVIAQQIGAHARGIDSALRPLEPIGAVRAWHAEIRAVEEYINVLRFGFPQDVALQRIRSIPLGDRLLPELQALRARVAAGFDAALADRFVQTLLKASALGMALRGAGIRSAAGDLETIGGACDYFQSRRRHYVALFYLLPQLCAGRQALDPLDTLNVLGVQVEVSGIQLMGLQQQLVLSHVFPDFTLEVDARGARPNRQHEWLEADFLEPERASIVALQQVRGAQPATVGREIVLRNTIFSAAELRNNVRDIGAAYAPYGLDDDHFREIARIVTAISRQVRDGYNVKLHASWFDGVIAAQRLFPQDRLRAMLVSRAASYAEALNGYQPFVQVGDWLISNVNLLTRFVYAFKSVHLRSRRRFTINAGFIFEDLVKRDLAHSGFQVTSIRRIDRREFDAVAVRDGVIFNLQCKNNAIDLAQIESKPQLFARANARLVRYYERSLAKEQAREGLLKRELGHPTVRHLVVSRFPVLTDHPQIVPHNRLEAWLASA